MAETRKQDVIDMGIRVAEADFFVDSGRIGTWDGKLAVVSAINSLYDEAAHQAEASGRFDEFEAAMRRRTQELEKKYAVT